ncbi:MAG: phosphatidate cytidylyltransferase [Pirellulales bacterium]
MLRWRLVSAAILISSLLTVVWLDYRLVGFGRPGAWLLPLALLAVAQGVREFRTLLAGRGLATQGFETYFATLAVLLSAGASLWGDAGARLAASGGVLAGPALAMALAVLMLFVGEMARYREPGGVTQRIAASLLIVAYLGLLGGFLVLLRIWRGNEWGVAALTSMILVVKLSDAGAYFAGRLFGRHPMAPRLSPKKTIEGGLGGIGASVAGAGLYCHFVLPHLVPDAPEIAPWRWAAYGVLLAVTGMLGDLAESLVKRDLGQKDSGALLPGMGGILDVLDSLLFGAPVAYACWSLGLMIAP